MKIIAFGKHRPVQPGKDQGVHFAVFFGYEAKKQAIVHGLPHRATR